MENDMQSAATDFLAKLDVEKTYASIKEESTLRLSDLFRTFYPLSGSGKTSPKTSDDE